MSDQRRSTPTLPTRTPKKVRVRRVKKPAKLREDLSRYLTRDMRAR